jgi:hypothetical protein
VGTPMAFAYFFASPNSESGQLNNEFLFVAIPIFSIIYGIVTLSWLWSLGMGINKVIHTGIRPKSKFFRFGIVFTGVYMFLFTAIFLASWNSDEISGTTSLIVPLHFLAMYCMFYSIHFVAKNIVTYELQEEVEFESYSGPFFFLWLYPIGIWLIQPRINRIYHATKS